MKPLVAPSSRAEHAAGIERKKSLHDLALEAVEERERAAPWMAGAQLELGVHERAGDADNPRILEYHETTIRTRLHKWFADAVPWCSSFVNWAFKKVGITGTNNPSAISWAKWGVPCEPKFGAVLVLTRQYFPVRKRHVCFYFDEDGEDFLVLGGNQKNEVSIERRPKKRLVACRWPK